MVAVPILQFRLAPLMSANRYRDGAKLQHPSYDKGHIAALLSASVGMPGSVARVFLLKLSCFSGKLAPFHFHRKLTSLSAVRVADSRIFEIACFRPMS